MNTGTENWRGGCNAPGKPKFAGQKIRYRSPFHRDVILADVGHINRYGHLIWIADLDATIARKSYA